MRSLEALLVDANRIDPHCGLAADSLVARSAHNDLISTPRSERSSEVHDFGGPVGVGEDPADDLANPVMKLLR